MLLTCRYKPSGGWPILPPVTGLGWRVLSAPERVRPLLRLLSHPLSVGISPGSVPHLTPRRIETPESAAPNADCVLRHGLCVPDGFAGRAVPDASRRESQFDATCASRPLGTHTRAGPSLNLRHGLCVPDGFAGRPIPPRNASLSPPSHGPSESSQVPTPSGPTIFHLNTYPRCDINYPDYRREVPEHSESASLSFHLSPADPTHYALFPTWRISMNPQPLPFQSPADLASVPFRPMVLPQVPHFQVFAQVPLPHPLCFHAFVQLKGEGGTPFRGRVAVSGFQAPHQSPVTIRESRARPQLWPSSHLPILNG